MHTVLTKTVFCKLRSDLVLNADPKRKKLINILTGDNTPLGILRTVQLVRLINPLWEKLIGWYRGIDRVKKYSRADHLYRESFALRTSKGFTKNLGIDKIPGVANHNLVIPDFDTSIQLVDLNLVCQGIFDHVRSTLWSSAQIDVGKGKKSIGALVEDDKAP